MMDASVAPSPKTVCVPLLYRSHAVQRFAAARTLASVGRSGISSAAVFFGILSYQFDVTTEPRDFDPSHRASPHRLPQLVVAHRGQRVDVSVRPHRPPPPRRIVG